MNEVDDEMLMAYVDGELGPDARDAVERALAASPTLREEVQRQHMLRSSLGAFYAPVAEEEAPERLRAMLAPEAKGAEIVDFAAARDRRRPVFALPHFAAMAASLAVGVIATQLALAPAGPVTVESGALLAQGHLAEALETQLASAGAAGDTRIGLTFADREGRICRTFESPAVSGIGCRGDAGWVLPMTSAGRNAGEAEYRQASSPLVMEQAQAMMAGAPLDAAAEAAAKAKGWRP